MHSGCLGVSSYVVGAVMTERVFDGPFDGDLNARVDALSEEIHIVYNITGATRRISKLTVNMFYHGPTAWAAVSGKAAETRGLVYVMRAICEAWNTHSRRDEHRLVILN